MGLGNIRFGGLGSGLDTNAIVEALISLERNKIAVVQDQKQQQQDKISSFGTLRGLVKTLQDKAKQFTGSNESVRGYSVTASTENIASFSVTGAPTAGSHTLEVLALAKSDKYSLSSAAKITDADAKLSNGTVSFDYDGTSYSVSGTYSLNELAGQINSAASGAVSASVVNVGTTNSPDYQLILSGDDTGQDFAIQNLTVGITELDTTTSLATAQNAQVKIDNLTVERSTNEFVDIIPGVTFTAQGLTTSAITVDVGLDTEATKSNVKEVVDAYNAVVDFLNKQSSYDEENGVGGNLFGDSALSTVRSTISAALFNRDLTTVQNDPDGFSTLGLIGIDLQSDGRIKIDDATFDAKLAEDPAQFEALFTDSSTGVFVNLENDLNLLVKGGTDANGNSFKGILDLRRDSLRDRVRSLDKDIDRLEEQVARTEEALVLKFANLEGLLSNLNAQQSYLTSGFRF